MLSFTNQSQRLTQWWENWSKKIHLELDIWGTSWSLNVLHATWGAHGPLSTVAELNKAASKGCAGRLLPRLVTKSAFQKSERLVTVFGLGFFSLIARFLFHSCRKFSVSYCMFTKPWEDQSPKGLRPPPVTSATWIQPWNPQAAFWIHLPREAPELSACPNYCLSACHNYWGADMSVLLHV